MRHPDSEQNHEVDFQEIPFEILTRHQLIEEVKFQQMKLSLDQFRSRKELLVMHIRNWFRTHHRDKFTFPITALIQKYRSPIVVPTQDNPYQICNEMLIDLIATHRGVEVVGNVEQKREQLQELDRIVPDWIVRIRSTPRQELSSLNEVQLLVYAAIYHLNPTILLPILDRVSNPFRFLNQVITGALIIPAKFERPPPRPIQECRLKVTKITSFLLVTREGYLPSKIGMEIYQELLLDSSRRDVLHLVEYPIRVTCRDYTFISRLSAIQLEIILQLSGYPISTISFLDRSEMIFLATRGYLPRLDLDQFQARYQDLISLPDMIQQKLINIYQAYDAPHPIHYMARITPSPLETIIRATLHYSIDLIATNIGMNFPLHLSASQHEDYFWSNFHLYRDVITRSIPIPPLALSELQTAWTEEIQYDEIPIRELWSLLHHRINTFSDRELMLRFRVYLNYHHRAHLLNQLIQVSYQSLFFIPFDRQCINSETTLLEPTRTSNVMIIGYGTLDSYWGYEIEELLQVFQIEEQNYISRGRSGNFTFRHPENLQLTFNRQEIEQLTLLLTPFVEGAPLVHLLQRCLPICYPTSEFEQRLINQFDLFPSSQKDYVHEALQRLLEASMYMRRWEGPGHPYPLSHDATRRLMTQDQIDANVTNALNHLDDQLYLLVPEVLAFFNSLQVKDWKDNTYVPVPEINSYLQRFLDKVRRGKMCIRVTSYYFISTVSYYYLILFKEILPQVPLQLLSRIS